MVAATTSAEVRFVTLFELFGKQPLANRLFQGTTTGEAELVTLNRLFLGTTTAEAGLVTLMKLGKWLPPSTD